MSITEIVWALAWGAVLVRALVMFRRRYRLAKEDPSTDLIDISMNQEEWVRWLYQVGISSIGVASGLLSIFFIPPRESQVPPATWANGVLVLLLLCVPILSVIQQEYSTYKFIQRRRINRRTNDG